MHVCTLTQLQSCREHMVISTTHCYLYVAYKIDDLLIKVVDVESLATLFFKVEVLESSGEIVNVFRIKV